MMKDRFEMMAYGWIPRKRLAEEFQGYKISKSSPNSSKSRTVQFSIRKDGGDLLRADSYTEGYFAGYWLSTINLDEFLQSAERFFQDLESSFSEKARMVLGILTPPKEPELYEFQRPLRLADFLENGIFIGDSVCPLNLLRLETPAGDLVYEPSDERVGVIADLESVNNEGIIQAMAELAETTQPLLTQSVVARTLNLLPYRKTAVIPS